MAEALISFAKGKSKQPVRTIFRPPEALGLMGLMPSYRSEVRPVFGLKAVCVFPGNPAKGKDAHQGAVLLFSAETGELLAIENASAITAIRTAAVSAVATDLLAKKDAGVLAIRGGIQGRVIRGHPSGETTASGGRQKWSAPKRSWNSGVSLFLSVGR
jgi:ornithine cyclodeaminase